MRVTEEHLDLLLRESVVPRGPMDDEGSRVLLASVLRRAVQDWVTYRSAGSRSLRRLAGQAYVWMFEEKPGHWAWELRCRNGRQFLSFVSVCDALGLDPARVRARARGMTPDDIRKQFRPTEARKD